MALLPYRLLPEMTMLFDVTMAVTPLFDNVPGTRFTTGFTMDTGPSVRDDARPREFEAENTKVDADTGAVVGGMTILEKEAMDHPGGMDGAPDHRMLPVPIVRDKPKVADAGADGPLEPETRPVPEMETLVPVCAETARAGALAA